MKRIPKYVLRAAWIAGVRAMRRVLVATERKKNKNYEPPRFWKAPDNETFSAEYEAGMKAVARILLDWSRK